MATSPPRPSRQTFWWPKVDTAENAASAAKYGGVAFGFIALGYVIATLFAAVGWRNPLQPDSAQAQQVYVAINLVVFVVSAILAWRTYRKPSLLLCGIALVWVLAELASKAASIGIPSNFIGAYWGQILGTVAGIGGLRGVWAVRGFRRSLPPGGSV